MADKRHYLKEWREHRGLRQDDVVDRLAELKDEKLPGTAATLSRIENGKLPFSERHLYALAEIYTVEPWELIGRNPLKEGQVVSLWDEKFRRLDERQQKQALAIIEALSDTG